MRSVPARWVVYALVLLLALVFLAWAANGDASSSGGKPWWWTPQQAAARLTFRSVETHLDAGRVTAATCRGVACTLTSETAPGRRAGVGDRDRFGVDGGVPGGAAARGSGADVVAAAA